MRAAARAKGMCAICREAGRVGMGGWTSMGVASEDSTRATCLPCGVASREKQPHRSRNLINVLKGSCVVRQSPSWCHRLGQGPGGVWTGALP